jgi:hypothetical protein
MQLCRFRSKVEILGVLIFVALSPSAAFAQSGSTGGSISNDDRSLSGPRNDEAERPTEEGRGGFDGAWTFTSAGCSHTGTLPAVITDGRIFNKGGSGQVDPDGTLHSVGAGNGMTLTAVGQLSGNMGAGTFNRSDGCVGSWIAIKQR